MEAYRKWVLSNKQWLSTIESLASSLTWFLPDRFAESELAPEALSSLIGVFSALNSHIIATAPPEPPGNDANPSTTATQGTQGRGTLRLGAGREATGGESSTAGAPGGGSRGPNQGSTAGAPEGEGPRAVRRCGVEWAVLALSLVREVEVLGEMGAEHLFGGEHRKWSAVALIEGLKAILRLLLVRHGGQWHLLQEGSTCYHPEEAQGETPNREHTEQQQQQGNATQRQHPGQHLLAGPQQPWVGPGYANTAEHGRGPYQGAGAQNGFPPGPSMGWPHPHPFPPHHPSNFPPFPPAGPLGLAHPSQPIPCPQSQPGSSFHPLPFPPPMPPPGWQGHENVCDPRMAQGAPWAHRAAEGNTQWGAGDTPGGAFLEGGRERPWPQPHSGEPTSGPLPMGPPGLGAPWKFSTEPLPHSRLPDSSWRDTSTPSSSGSTLGSSAGVPFPSPGHATPPTPSSTTHLESGSAQSVQNPLRDGGDLAEASGVYQDRAGSPGADQRANGESSDAAGPMAPPEIQAQSASEPKSKALLAFLRFQGRLGAGETSRRDTGHSSAEQPESYGPNAEAHSGLGSIPNEGIQHPGHPAGAPWAPPTRPLPHQAHAWPQGQPFVGPFGGWHQPGRPGQHMVPPGTALDGPWDGQAKGVPGPEPQAWGPEQRPWPQQGHSEEGQEQEGYRGHTSASGGSGANNSGAKPGTGGVQALLVCSEVLHVVRPLAYVLALRRWGKQSWKPWAASLALDLASLALLHGHLSRLRASLPRRHPPQGQQLQGQGPGQQGQGPGQQGQGQRQGQGQGQVKGAGQRGAEEAPERSEAEKAVLAELQRRKYLLILYLMRSPCFETVTKPPLEALHSRLSSIPLLGSLAGRGWDMLLGIQSLYFYTAGS